ncbi:hypothetical protein [Streptomyces sp. WG7]|uniref:hypothetical protein n=1 Tax=Streptomyces sp. WG7 TaxID=3417650 RepID=UPI003CF64C1E
MALAAVRDLRELARAQALTTYFLFLELRHKVEIHRMTGRVVECPIDDMNRPRGSKDAEVASWEVVYGFDLIRGFAPASGWCPHS